MAAAAPPSARPVTVTGLSVPTFLSAKYATALLVTNVTSSPSNTPANPALVASSVAFVVPSYTWSRAGRFVTVSATALTVMFTEPLAPASV